MSLAFQYDIKSYLSLDFMKLHQHRFELLVASAPMKYFFLFFMGYTLLAALSLPGAAVTTVLLGALFGFTKGVILVSFASTFGATLAFLLSRYLFYDLIEEKWGKLLEPIYQGVEDDGPFYLFTLRLIPLIPFFLINLFMGLTPMRVWTFMWVSQLGMLPGTFAYVNAGKQLASIESLADILSFRVVISFVVIGLLPLISKKILGLFQNKKGS